MILDVSREYASPNHNERKGNGKVSLLILHYTGMGSDDAALSWLCNPESSVSSHYFVHQDGRVLQLVDEERRAWHAGVSSWKGVTDINSASIGIEIANSGHDFDYPVFPSVQIEAVTTLCAEIVERHGIEPRNVLAHSDVAPLRKKDPGEKFPWGVLHEGGVGHLATPAPITGGRFFQKGDAGEPIAALQSLFALYGYGVDITGQFDDLTEAVVIAFQRHFRPELVDGIADQSTIETLKRLLES